MDRLEFLLQRYKSNTATPEEIEELSGLMDSEFKDNSDPGKLGDAAEEDLKMVFGKLDSVPLPQPGRGVRFKRPKVWLAAAATFSIALIAGIWLISDSARWFHSSIALERDAIARYAGKQLVNLPDGSKVVLNANSELNFNGASFGKETREVNLVGEATFDVVHDPSKPFVVHTGKVNTKVLGTEFNVQSYPEMDKIIVTVLRGLVEVSDKQKVYGRVRPNEQIAVNTVTNNFVQQETNAAEAVRWKSAFLILDNVSLEEAATLIGEKFNVEIIFENAALKNCRFVGTFLNDESLSDVLTVISTTMRIKFEIEKNTNVVSFSGKGCD